MIVGIGIDIVDIQRIRRSLERYGEHFLDHVYTPGERADCEQLAEPAPRLAAYFSVKEAAYKALAPPRSSHWRDFEVGLDPGGRPAISYHGLAEKAARDTRSLVSFTCTDRVAIATVVVIQPG